MPKAKYASRDKPKKKGIKSTAVLGGKRKLSRFGKKQKAGYSGNLSKYIPRTKAIKKLQIPLSDFRKLCILKGIYPRDPMSKKFLDPNQTYYHYKDIQYLMHEPLMKKFRETKAFMKKLKRAIGRNELDNARRMYEDRPSYNLDHIMKERYPRFADAIGDLDDCLSLVHLFASFPAEHPVKPEHTSLAKRLVREWQYFITRSHSLRKVFFSIKGTFYQVDVKGQQVTWLQPWPFSQALPSDVDYKVMLTFLELSSVLLRFVMFKLYHDIGLSYPPKIKIEQDAMAAHLTAVDVEEIPGNSSKSASSSAPKDVSVNEETAARLVSLQAKLKSISASSKPSAEDEGDEPEDPTAQLPRTPVHMYDFVDVEDEEDTALTDMAEFEASEEVKLTIEKAKALQRFKSLFKGLVFFIGREVPRDIFEFLACAFRGRIGWDGAGSPYTVDDPRITHQIMDRPLYDGFVKVEGREYVQPQWVADSINAHMLLPTARYAIGEPLPPHLSPFVDDAAEGYIPAYREELERLRAAAAVTGRLADVIEAGVADGGGNSGVRSSRMGADADEILDSDDEEEEEEEEEEEVDEDEEDEDVEDDDDEEDEEEGSDDDDEEDEEEEDDEALLEMASGKKPRLADKKPAAKSTVSIGQAEADRNKAAAALLSRNKRDIYERAMKEKQQAQEKVNILKEKRQKIEAAEKKANKSKDAKVGNKRGRA